MRLPKGSSDLLLNQTGDHRTGHRTPNVSSPTAVRFNHATEKPYLGAPARGWRCSRSKSCLDIQVGLHCSIVLQLKNAFTTVSSHYSIVLQLKNAFTTVSSHCSIVLQMKNAFTTVSSHCSIVLQMKNVSLL